MPLISSAFPKDANHVPIQYLGILTTDSQTLGGTGTVHVPIYTITGTVMVNAIYGVVTTVLGANNTAAYWRFNDQTTQSDITLNTGTTITTAPVGSVIVKKGLTTAALTLLSASQQRVSEPTTLETSYFSPFTLVAKPGATSQIEFTYTTTDNPTTGAIEFFLWWVPISSDGNVVNV